VIEHDVRRLDRLVSDISNASRLDSELVKEEEEEFNLLQDPVEPGRVSGPAGGREGRGVHHRPAARADHLIHGLEARLAQVFVNLITNAISFCEEGDAVRVWARRRENRVLVVVEDTGPRHPRTGADQGVQAVLFRTPAGSSATFRPWPCDLEADRRGAWRGDLGREHPPDRRRPTSEPLGARFVVGLPV
jgi:two-component system, OmpR family, sensor histidine kinase ChvG